jgi:hypothetical protein
MATYLLYWEKPWSCHWSLGWGLAIFYCVLLTTVPAALYGYWHRNTIDPGGVKSVDLSKAYLGVVFAAFLTPVARPLFDYLGCSQ